MLGTLARLVARQVAILLIALSLVLPRLCTMPADAAAGTLAHDIAQSHCADHPGASHDKQSGHGCCDQCQCCAAPATQIPGATRVKLRLVPAEIAIANKSVAQRAILAFAILPINSHGPPLFS